MLHRKEKGEASALETKLIEYASTKDSLIQKNLKGVVSDSILKQQLDSIEKKELEDRASLAMLGNTVGSPEEVLEFIEEYLTSPSTIWKKANISTQIKLPVVPISSGTIYDGKRIWNYESIKSVFKAKEVILSPLSATVDFIGLYWDGIVDELHQWSKVMYFAQSLNLSPLLS